MIEKRREDGHVYYYLVESARVDGKPRIVSQQYLGSAAELAARLCGEPVGVPIRCQHKRFGFGCCLVGPGPPWRVRGD